MLDELIFLYKKDPQNWSIDLISNIELMAEKIELKMRTNFQDNVTGIIERMKNEKDLRCEARNIQSKICL